MRGFSDNATFTLQRDTSDEEVIRIIQKHTTRSVFDDYVEIKHARSMVGTSTGFEFLKLENLASFFIEGCEPPHPEFEIWFETQKRGRLVHESRYFRCIS